MIPAAGARRISGGPTITTAKRIRNSQAGPVGDWTAIEASGLIRELSQQRQGVLGVGRFGADPASSRSWIVPSAMNERIAESTASTLSEPFGRATAICSGSGQLRDRFEPAAGVVGDRHGERQVEQRRRRSSPASSAASSSRWPS